MNDWADEVCSTCLFCINHQCRFNPPTFIYIGIMKDSRYPEVKGQKACSHWKEKITVPIPQK